MAKAHEELDEAEWLIGVLGARLDGFVEPLRPAPRHCRRPASSTASTVSRPSRSTSRASRCQRVPVRSCAACAVGLVRGERPRVGTVSMGGRALPWPAAPRWCGSYAWALKDLKHLHYDGTPLFAAPERPIGQRRQTVAERARGMRARVLPAGPEVLPEDEIDEVDEVEESFEAFEDETPEVEHDEQDAAARGRADQHRRLRRHGGRGAGRDRDGARRGQRHPARVAPRPRGPAGAAAAAR